MLYYHKCDDCLTAFTTDVNKVDFCDCNGSVTFMGVVQGDQFVKTENKPACDGRCTHASGPHCDCQCGGINHGTGRLVAVVVKEGKVYATELAEEDVERANMYRSVRDLAQSTFDKKFGATLEKRKQRIWVDHKEWSECYRAQHALEKAIGLRQHLPRIKALTNFIIAHKT